MNRQQRRQRLADAKASHARDTSRAAQAHAAGVPIVALVYDTTTVWMLGGATCITPTLPKATPSDVRERVERRVLSNLTGACVNCGAATSMLAAGHAHIQHRAGCDLADVEVAA